MDAIDKKLIVFLQENAKQTNKELALKLNLSVTAVFERIRKLERNKTIERYAAVINRKKIDKNFVVFCHVKLIQHAQDQILQFEKEIARFPEVLECYHISGDYDYILKICMKDMEEYREFMVKKLTKINHIGSTHSTFMIGEVKSSSIFILE